MKIVAVSDLHGLGWPEIPPCDVLILGGDLAPDNEFTIKDRHKCALRQSYWLETEFVPWVDAQPAQDVVMIWGNHDYVGEVPLLYRNVLAQVPNLVLLQDSDVTIGGVKFYGTPWVTVSPGGLGTSWKRWAFDVDQAESDAKMDAIPGCDVLITHGPARGVFDTVPGFGSGGSPGIKAAVERVAPQLHVFGHIHEARGRATMGPLQVANVSEVNERYKPYREPVNVFEVR